MFRPFLWLVLWNEWEMSGEWNGMEFFEAKAIYTQFSVNTKWAENGHGKVVGSGKKWEKVWVNLECPGSTGEDW